jgi:hypothetical protein
MDVSVLNKKMICILAGITVLLSSCGSIEQKSYVEQPIGEVRMVGVGDVVLRINTLKSLPNAYGKADIFGRTTPTGVTTMVYEGIQNGRAIFSRKSIDIDSRATTMNSSPVVVSSDSTTTHNGNVGNMSFSGKSTTKGSMYALPPNTPDPVYLERSRNFIAVDVAGLPQSFVVEGIMVRVLSAEPLALRYVLEK